VAACVIARSGEIRVRCGDRAILEHRDHVHVDVFD